METIRLVHDLRQAAAFSPAHVTGFFQICDQPRDPLLKGSRGAGFSITKGVRTTVRLVESTSKTLRVKVNGKTARSAEVSKAVAIAFLKLGKSNYRVEIGHEIEVPIGCGFGSSGAGALSLALAMNEALDLRLPLLEAAKLAHVAEIKCKTGLGTVIAETFGGAEIRVKPGAPGVGRIEPIRINGNCAVACLCFGPMSTRRALTDPRLRRLINSSGRKLTDELLKQPTVPNFLKYSRSFAESTQLMSKKVREVLTETYSQGFQCSMAIFGDTVFSLVKQNETQELMRIYRKYVRHHETIVTGEIDFRGVRIAQ